MNYFRLIVLLVFMIGFGSQSAINATPSDRCPIAKSIYRDAEGKGFQLVFGSPPPGTPFHATATIKHRQQNQLYRFVVSQSSGYGSIFLLEQTAKHSKDTETFWITFFDRNLKSANPLWLGEEKVAPSYAVIAELGSYDYYQRRGNIIENSPPPIQDVMWIFDRCQSEVK